MLWLNSLLQTAARRGLAVSAVALLAGCASLSSTRPTPAGDGQAALKGEGLVYYLPKRDFLVNLVIATTGTTIDVVAGSSYADLSNPRLLQYHGGFLTENKLDVGVSEAGLLTSAKSVDTITADDFVTIGTGLGNLAGLSAKAQVVAPAATAACPTETGTHTFVVSAEQEKSSVDLCAGLNVAIERIGGTKGSVEIEVLATTDNRHPGVFYRQNRPYKLVATGFKARVEKILHSPSGSPEMLLPVARGVFSTRDGSITLDEGVPKAWVQKGDSEFVGLLTLPAKAIGPYFDAVGNLFSKFATNSTNEVNALAAATKLEMAKIKYAACVDALKAKPKDEDLIKNLKCGE